MLCDILDRFSLGLGIVALTLIINRLVSMKTASSSIATIEQLEIVTLPATLLV
jgi:hypothetical protein